MFVIFGSKEMTKTVANIYIWNLALADTLFLVTLPFSATQRLLGKSWPFGAIMCKVSKIKYIYNPPLTYRQLQQIYGFKPHSSRRGGVLLFLWYRYVIAFP